MNLSKIAVLAYGALTYLFFLATYLYCIGFLTNAVVPKTIDSVDGELASTGHALLVNAGILGIFAIQHLIMARSWFKRRITKWIPAAAERSTFVFVTCAILCALFAFWEPMPGIVWEVETPALRMLMTGLSLLGFGGVVLTSYLIDHFELFGLKQVLRNFRGERYGAPAFQVRSLYRFTRHPLYLFFFIAFWCAPTMTVGHLAFALLCTAFVFVGVQFEERSLVQEHGQAYRDYQREVPMIVPRAGHSSEPIAPVRPEATPACVADPCRWKP